MDWSAHHRGMAWLAALLPLAACSGRAPSSPASTSPAVSPAPDDPFADIPYASAPLPATAKVFLVAGGDDVANFAADVLEQRELWKKSGLRDDEIACYYAKPSERARQDDGDQLAELAPQLRDCYPANPATLHAHLRQAAHEAPPFLYLFVSSHGLPPLLRWGAGVDDANELPPHYDLRRGEVGRFDRHAIGLEAGQGPGLGDIDEMLEAHRAGASAETLVFTPDTLAAALAELPDTTHTIIVLQACFSGGFIGRPDDDGPSPLTHLPRTTLLTASSATRPSFGCSPGASRTYYGGALNHVLADTLEEDPRPPSKLPWRTIYERVRFVVETLEFIEGESASQPGFFTNLR